MQAYDQRDEAQSKILAMKEKNEKDAKNFAEEMKELQRTLDHDEKLKDFLFHKSNDRAFASDFGEDEKGDMVYRIFIFYFKDTKFCRINYIS